MSKDVTSVNYGLEKPGLIVIITTFITLFLSDFSVCCAKFSTMGLPCTQVYHTGFLYRFTTLVYIQVTQVTYGGNNEKKPI